MGALDEINIPSLRLEEILSDGSTLTNPAADSRRLFLGEDGLLHLRDSAGTVTDIGGGSIADILDLPTAETDDTLVLAPDGVGGVEFRAETGGGGSDGYSDLLLDIPPSSPDADDDEFPGTSLDGAWLDPVTSAAGQTNTITVGGGWLVLEPATAGTGSTGKHVFGIRKVSPAGSFKVSGKVTSNAISTDLRPGVFVAKTGGGGYICGPGYSGSLGAVSIGFTGYSETADWGGYDGVHLVGTGGTGTSEPWLGWYRIRYDAGATTVYFDYSVNGVLWKNFASKGSVAQPDRMGVALWSNGGTIAADDQFGVGWFRVIDGSAAF